MLSVAHRRQASAVAIADHGSRNNENSWDRFSSFRNLFMYHFADSHPRRTAQSSNIPAREWTLCVFRMRQTGRYPSYPVQKYRNRMLVGRNRLTKGYISEI